MKSAVRVSLQYSLLFGTTGVVMPFAALWLASTGMSGAQIGLLLALPMVGRLATGPLMAVWADGFHYRKTAIALLGLAMALGYGAAALVDSTLLRGLFWFVGATACAAIIPLIDVLTLRVAQRDGYPFSLPRGFGSLAFVMANIGMGALLTQVSEQAVIIWIVAASALCAVFSVLALPAVEVSEGGIAQSGRERFKGLGRLLKNRTFMIAVLGVGAIQAAHGFYYSFSAILWKQQGIAESTTGLLWAFAVAGEIVFMWLIDPWRRKVGIGPFTLVIIGGIAAVLRWLLMATEPSVAFLLPLQALHALTFAAVYLGSVEIVSTLSPRQDHTSSQTLASMLSSGLMTGLATAASGPLYDKWGGLGYLPMAGLAVVGVYAVMAVRAEVRRDLSQIAEVA
ncbi:MULTISPECIES: MFS transporter [unclassified Brevundimonas]|uniref:MFS transporter n=1 Tax=unclassified Brevundimonas TaxID=2622653 RepID=UPI0025BC0773|nr:MULTISPECIES: MFS transporter [unclassified Brevundimonas]